MDSDGGQAADSTYGVTFRIYGVEEGGVEIWSETDSVTTDCGIFNVILGKQVALDLDFDETYWLSLEIGGMELTPRTELSPSPYAFRSAVSDSALEATHAAVSDLASEAAHATVADSAVVVGAYSDGDWETSGDDIHRLNGNVGIGTPSPDQLLTLEMVTDTDGILPVVRVKSYTDHPYRPASLWLGKSRGASLGSDVKTEDGDQLGSFNVFGCNASNEVKASGKIVFYQDGTAGNYVPGKITFSTSDGNTVPNYRMVIDKDGDVGIGTETPGQKLHVNGTASMTGFKMATDASPGLVLTCSDVLGTGTWQQPTWNISGADVYRPTGMVGIGAVPSYPLHLNPTTAGDHLVIERGTSGLKWSLSSVFGASGDLFSIAEVGGGHRLAIQEESGNVGIGTTIPTERLHVSGNALIEDGYLKVGGSEFGVVVTDATDHGLVVSQADESGLVVVSAGLYGIDVGGDRGSMMGSNNASYYGLTVNSHNASPTNPGLYVNGTFYSTGSKGTVTETSMGKELLHSVNAPDIEVMSSGAARLTNGQSKVVLERLFQETIEKGIPLKVIVTPQDTWSGLYVTDVSHEGFTVRSGAGDPSANFTWMVIGRRQGCETRPDFLAPEE
jgi:hypothetical protein